MPKTKLEIINETALFYSSNPSLRAINSNGGCEYKTSDGRTCAVGRCMLNPIIRNLDEVTQAWGLRIFAFDNILRVELELKPEYRGHPLEFWRNLQLFHDTPEFWISESEATTDYPAGLSSEGRLCLDRLREHWPDPA